MSTWVAFAVALVAIAIPPASAQTYPSRPVRIIVAGGVGNGADTLARLVAQHLGEHWGKSVIVENIPGAGGVLGTQAMVKAAPDGHTLGLISINHVTNPSFYPNAPYDTVRDLRGVINVTSSTILIVAHPTVPADSVAEFIKLAKSKPSAIDYGSSGNGTIPHLAMELFAQQAGIRLNHVPYSSSSQMTTDLIAGRVAVMAASGTSVLQWVNAGKLKPLIVATPQRSPYFPNTPTGADAGLPGFAFNSTLGIAAPAKTPDAIVARLHADIGTIARRKEFETQLVKSGVELNLLDGDQMWKRVADDIQLWNRVVRESGIKAN